MLPALATSLLALTLVQSSPDASRPAAPPPAGAAPVGMLEVGPPIPSLLSAAPLHGSTLLGLSLGWPRTRLAYAQGISPSTDLGLFVDLDESTTELRAGGSYRGRILPRAPPFDGALRLSFSWYRDFGNRWLYRHNHRDHGLELGVGLSYSRQEGGGVLSLLADLPVTITLGKGGGAFVSPRIAGAYEASLIGPLTVGLQLGLGTRIGVGDAPLRSGYPEVTVLGLVGWRIF